ncbi:3-hydroxyacyl-ACP dehydratase FabZ family protein [Lignipirellula cremea]|uniref:3-hydroxyacyl-[acyl-carrier-protein] dehydratase FabZ n=1 Tax=Lignipirellula cremea TaxID=2528010 RepID=A0A518DN15_9BACT|nr:3-hydroxyacyl-ACP dehydratase FabZ family protein [Lignipirellula cremea]QDU93228.1 3-hydroxyacyl-[acyl-carrier-protein] dehydratase FabZ [Lignipirellula cremea]
MTLEKIHAAIPHRRPMLLLDEIVEQSENQIQCRKTFTPDEFFFQGHYPDFPLVPGVILCESAMQAGAVLLSTYAAAAEGAVPVATRLGDVKFKKMVRPGDTILLNVTLNERLADTFFLTAKVTLDGKLAARFDFACTMAKVE